MIFYDFLWYSMILLWSPYPSIILYHIYGYIYIWIIFPNINGWRCQIRSYHPNCSTALLVFMIGSGVILSTGWVNPWISACWNDMTEIYRTKNPFSKSPLSPQYCQSPVISWLRKPMNYSYYSSNIFEPKTPVKLERFASTRAVNGVPSIAGASWSQVMLEVLEHAWGGVIERLLPKWRSGLRIGGFRKNTWCYKRNYR